MPVYCVPRRGQQRPFRDGKMRGWSDGGWRMAGFDGGLSTIHTNVFAVRMLFPAYLFLVFLLRTFILFYIGRPILVATGIER